MFKRRRKKTSLLGTLSFQIHCFCNYFFPGNLPVPTLSTYVLPPSRSTGHSSCAVVVFTFFTAYLVVTSSSALLASSQSLNLGILVAESCDDGLTTKIDQLASKAFDDVRRRVLQETGSASAPLRFSSTTYSYCEVRTVVKNLDDIFANGSVHAILVLASADLHASLVTVADIYGKAYFPLNNYMIISPDNIALSLAPTFEQQAAIMSRVMEMYQWQNVYVVYTDFKSFSDFALFFYITMTLSKFNVTLAPTLQSPVSDANAAGILQKAGATKAVLLLMDVTDQLAVLAAASSMSKTKDHAFFTFSKTPYDVTAMSLVGVKADVTSQPRFSNDTGATGVNIFSSVFTIASSFPVDASRNGTVTSKRRRRHVVYRTHSVPETPFSSLEQLESRSNILTFRSEPFQQNNMATNAELFSRTIDLDVHSENVKKLLNVETLYDTSVSHTTLLPVHKTTLRSSMPRYTDMRTPVSSTQAVNAPGSSFAQARNAAPAQGTVHPHFPPLFVDNDIHEKNSFPPHGSPPPLKNIEETTPLATKVNNALVFDSEEHIFGNSHRDHLLRHLLQQKSSFKLRSKRDLETFRLSDVDTKAVYDLAYAVAYSVYKYMETSATADFPLGQQLIQTVRNVTFPGNSGQYVIDSDGQQVLYDFTVYDYNEKTGVMEPRVFYQATSPKDWVLGSMGQISWPDGVVLGPDQCYKQLPNCNEGLKSPYIAAIVISALVLVVIGVIAAFIFRRYWLNKEMIKGPNKVILSSEDLVFVLRKDMGKGSRLWQALSNCGQSRTFHRIEHRQHRYAFISLEPLVLVEAFKKLNVPSEEWIEILKSRATLLEKDNAPDLIRGSDPNRSMASINELSDYTETARYNGDLVHVKELDIKGFEMRSKLLTFIRMCRDLRHENLNPYVGFLADPLRPSIVMEYCSRGSLNDIIHNEDFKLDWDFKLSLLTDLVRGVRYLHSSALKYHGHITSKNCVIDSRFVLKITDYGIPGIMERCKALQEFETRDLLWSAPELLRDPVLLQKGSDKGDLYAIAIIFQEVILRSEPYSTTGLAPEEIIKKLKKPPPLIRPSVTPQAAPPQFIQIMKQCWSEMPEMRPGIDEVYDQFKKLTGGKKANIVDTMFKMLEKYSTDLEDIVAERTMQLEEEKKKTDQLLFRMLPPTVAESLKIGRNVEAECFDEVTIYFSDIVGFTTISAMSTPMQVVDLLNDLYTMFDATINDHDVYKVETIGDAYMVVSGLPIRNGNRHAGEIGTLALVLLSQCGKFTIRHMPQVPLRLRIGLHTGSCVAGVVGLTMPRFCLFGDTVNTASRMESTGAAFRIHISETCKFALDVLGGYITEYRGQTELKGKGMHNTYWLVGKEGFDKELPEPPPLVGDNTHGLDSILGDIKLENMLSVAPQETLAKSCSAPTILSPCDTQQPELQDEPSSTTSTNSSTSDSQSTAMGEPRQHPPRQHVTSVVKADINLTGGGGASSSRDQSGDNLDVTSEAESSTSSVLKNKHSESNDSGFGSERKHSHGNETFAATPLGVAVNGDKQKRTKTSVVSSSDVTLHTNFPMLVDITDELTPVTEV